MNQKTEESAKNIIYIPQAFLSALAYENGSSEKERDNFLTKLLKKNEAFANAMKYCENFVSQNKVSIEQLIQEALNTHKNINEIKENLKEKGNIAEIKEEIEKKNKEIKKYKNIEISHPEIQEYLEKKKIIHGNNARLKILKNDQNILAEIMKEGVNLTISSQNLDFLSPSCKMYINDEFKNRSKKDLKDIIDKKLVEIRLDIYECEENLSSVKKRYSEIELKLKNNQAVKDLSNEISKLQEEIDLINKLSNEEQKLKERKKDTIHNIAEAYTNFENRLTLIYKTVKFDENFKFLKIDFVVRHNNKMLKEFVERKDNLTKHGSKHQIWISNS